MRRAKEILLGAALLSMGTAGYARTIDPSYEVGTWPGFRQAAVSYTFDDGCSNQFAIALPMFNQFGFKLTLFTITGPSFAGSLPNWAALQKAASQGHEVASHTVTHPYLNQLTLTNQTTELKDSQDDINAHLASLRCVTLAYPYCVPSDPALTAQYYIAARHCQGNTEGSTPANLYQISSIICGSQGSVKTAGDFSGRFESAATSKGWCVFLIHGIDNDGGYSPLSSATLRASLEYLDDRKDKFWVATFGDVVRYIRQRNDVSVRVLSNEDARMTLQVTDTLDNAIYTLPVTLSRPLPRGWPSANVLQNGHPVTTRVVGDSRKYIQFDVVPDSGEVIIFRSPAAPAGLTATAGRATVTLDWGVNTEADLLGYYVYRSTVSGSGYSRLNGTPLSGSTYEDANVPHDTTYYYVVTAVDTTGNESAYSNEVFGGLYGDFTGDGAVEANDLSVFCKSWLKNDCNETAGVDLDEDCTVRFFELSVLAGNWLTGIGD